MSRREYFPETLRRRYSRELPEPSFAHREMNLDFHADLFAQERDRMQRRREEFERDVESLQARLDDVFVLPFEDRQAAFNSIVTEAEKAFEQIETVDKMLRIMTGNDTALDDARKVHGIRARFKEALRRLARWTP